jgi:hypothetical protein
VLFEFEVREAVDPVDVANFKFGTLGPRQRFAGRFQKQLRQLAASKWCGATKTPD